MWLFDPSLVEGAVEGGGVALVLGEGGGEAVGAVHFVAGAEIQIIGFRVLSVDYSVYGSFRREADGGGWQAGVEVGVEGTLHRKVFVEDAFDGEVAHGILHRGVGLEGYAFVETIPIDAGYLWFLGPIVGFLFDD